MQKNVYKEKEMFLFQTIGLASFFVNIYIYFCRALYYEISVNF